MSIVKYFNGRDRVMAALAVLLTMTSLCIVLAYMPQLGDSVPMRVTSAGEVLRWGSKFELLVAPGLSIVLLVATTLTGVRQLKAVADQPAMARIGAHRHARNALVQSVVLLVATAVILAGAVTGRGIGF